MYDNDNIYYRRHMEIGFSNWRRIAFANEIPTVTNYYWANIKVSPTSSTGTYPTFGSLSVVNDLCNNNSTDALAYFQHRSNNDWTVKIDSGSYDYGLYINTSGNYALSVGPGASRFRGSVIVGADATPSFTLDVRGNIRATESLIISTNNTTGSGIIFANDGDIVDLNDAYCTMRFTSGIRITNANRGGGVVHELNVNGRLYNYGLYHYNYGSYDYLLTSNGDARHINSLLYMSWKE